MEKDKVKVCSLSEYEIYKDTDHEIDYDYMYDSIIDTITRAKEEYNISYLPKRYLYDICDMLTEQGVPKDENILYSLLDILNNCFSLCTDISKYYGITNSITGAAGRIVEFLGKNMSDRIRQSIDNIYTKFLDTTVYNGIRLFCKMIDHDILSREEINEIYERDYANLQSHGDSVHHDSIVFHAPEYPGARRFFKELYEKNKWGIVEEMIGAEKSRRKNIHLPFAIEKFGIDNYDMLNKILSSIGEGRKNDTIEYVEWSRVGVSPECLENLVMSMGIPAQNIHDFYVKNETIINSEVYFYLLNKILEKTEGFRSHVSRGYEDMVKTKNLLIKNSNKYSNHPKYKEYLFKTAKKELDFSKNSSEFEELINKDKATREEIMDIWNRIKSPLVALYIKILEVCKRSGLRDTFCDIMSELVYTKSPKSAVCTSSITKYEDRSEILINLFRARIPWGRQDYKELFGRYIFSYYMWELHGEYYLIDWGDWREGHSQLDAYVNSGSIYGISFEELKNISKKVEGIEGIKGKTKIIKYCINKYIKSSNAYEKFRVKDR